MVTLKLARTTLRELAKSGKLALTAEADEAAQIGLRATVTPSTNSERGGRKAEAVARRRKPRAKPIGIASGTVRFTAPGRQDIALKLNRKGRRAVKRLRRAKLTVSARAIDENGRASTKTASEALRR